MVYGSQQWPSIMKMDTAELEAAYHCVSLIKNAEADATKAAMDKAKGR